jgi:hypothetical protein
MFDLKKSLEAGKISLAAMIGIGLVAAVLSLVPIIGLVGGLLSLFQFFVLNPILLGYVGYNGSKKFGMDLTSAALSGGFIGLVASVVMSVVGIVLAMIGFGAAAASYGPGMEAAGTAAVGAVSFVLLLIGAVISVAIHTVGGLVCAAIGSFIATSGVASKVKK